MTRFKKGQNVLVYDPDHQAWRFGLILKVREHEDRHTDWLNLFPLIIPDEGQWCYYIQYIDPDQIESDGINGVYLEVAYAQDNSLIVLDTPLARAIYLGE